MFREGEAPSLKRGEPAEKVFKSVEVPNAQGRYTDGIDDAWKRILELRKMGYTDIPSPSGQKAIYAK